MKLRLKEIPKLTGKDAKNKVNQIMRVLETVKWPLYFVGPSGTSKSIIAMNVAKLYAKHHKVPAYYVQLSPDQTKTSLILGLRLVNGSLVPVKGMLAEAMEKGGIVIIDEATHGTQELLLMFNSILDRTSVTSIGDEVVYAEDSFRVIFCGNTSQYAGNVKLPQSFAQRLITFNFDYPPFEDEVKISVAMFENEYNGDCDIPIAVAKYITSVMREARDKYYPLSARNVVGSLILMATYDVKEVGNNEIEEFLTSKGGNFEAVIRRIYRRINDKDPESAALAVSNSDVRAFLAYIVGIGEENFRQSILQGMLYYLDIDGWLNVDEAKDKLFSMII